MGNRIGVDISGNLVRVTATLSEGLGLVALRESSAQPGSDPGFPRQRSCGIDNPEDVLLEFMSKAPIWGDPWVFDHQYEPSKKSRVYCFIFDFSDIEPILQFTFEGLAKFRLWVEEFWNEDDLRKRTAFAFQVVGSNAQKLAQVTQEMLARHNEANCPPGTEHLKLDIHLSYEIRAVVHAINFLQTNVPQCFYFYKETINTVTDASQPAVHDIHLLPIQLTEPEPDFYPYLLVNMKAGVSFHIVNGISEVKRVGGSPIGHATFLGLTSLLCGSVPSPFDAMLFAQQGDQTKVDMLVSDIYGGDYLSRGLKGSMVASTLGKMQIIKPLPGLPMSSSAASIEMREPHLSKYLRGGNGGESEANKTVACQNQTDTSKLWVCPPSNIGRVHYIGGVRCRDALGRNSTWSFDEGCRIRDHFASQGSGHRESNRPPLQESRRCCFESQEMVPSQADLARSLLNMTSFNIAHLAWLNASLYGLKRIVLIGFYLEVPAHLASIQHCIHYWSEGKCKVNFVRVAPFLGAFGSSLISGYR